VYAVVRDRSRSLKLEPGQELWVDHMPQVEPGSELVFDRVELVSGDDGQVRVGTPTVEGASVVAEVVDHVRGPKLLVSFFRRRKSSRRKQGHRQPYTQIRVKEIRA